jgi:uncharacterized OB-fold protein
MSNDSPAMFVPTPSALTQPFWDGARQGTLLRQVCTVCGFNMFPPQFACSRCLSVELEWLPSAGLGVMYSYTHAFLNPSGGALPGGRIIIDVDLDEGWHMMSVLEDCPVEDAYIGMPLEVAWRRLDDDISLAVFVPRRTTT